MDCCGSTKPKDTEKDIKSDHEGVNHNMKARQPGNENNPVKEQNHGGGCCGGGGSGMWLHLIIMLIVFVAIWYSSNR